MLDIPIYFVLGILDNSRSVFSAGAYLNHVFHAKPFWRR